MSTHDELGPPDARRAEFSRAVHLQADRVRGLPLARLDRPAAGESTSPADAVRAAAQELADLAADAEGRDRRPLPRLATHGLGDQLAVVGADVVRSGTATTLAAAHDVLARVRRALP
ncbi:hypothetical protein [Kineococcus rhizosphaerae]|uniref:Uncharacterized protein n=1 Tax=Kineococcus rhizosphaerae TaxID=559628 RepID=A0A2T0R4D9_9ACTN|nr:hypothetical protein [Kineococcus rhizosphaerae]PRY15236.1 hypothetical protein CLV37_105162 [Kineococcus rhizosphaerae]